MGIRNRPHEGSGAQGKLTACDQIACPYPARPQHASRPEYGSWWAAVSFNGSLG